MPVDPLEIMQRLQGAGFTPEQSAGIVGNIQHESNFDPNALNAPEGAYGFMQWRGDRRTGLEDYAASQDLPPADVGAQVGNIRREYEGPEARNYQRSFEGTNDPGEIARRLSQYVERAAPGTEDQRARYANAAYRGSGGSQVAQVGYPSAGFVDDAGGATNRNVFGAPDPPSNTDPDGLPTGFHPNPTPIVTGDTGGAGGAGGAPSYQAGGGDSSRTEFNPLNMLNPLWWVTKPIDLGFGLIDEARHASGMYSSADKLKDYNRAADIIERSAGMRAGGTTTIPADPHADSRIESIPIDPTTGTSPYVKAQGREEPYSGPGSSVLNVITGQREADLRNAATRIQEAKLRLKAGQIEAARLASEAATRASNYRVDYGRRKETHEFPLMDARAAAAGKAGGASEAAAGRSIYLTERDRRQEGYDTRSKAAAALTAERNTPDIHGFTGPQADTSAQGWAGIDVKRSAENRAIEAAPGLLDKTALENVGRGYANEDARLNARDPTTGLTTKEFLDATRAEEELNLKRRTEARMNRMSHLDAREALIDIQTKKQTLREAIATRPSRELALELKNMLDDEELYQSVLTRPDPVTRLDPEQTATHADVAAGQRETAQAHRNAEANDTAVNQIRKDLGWGAINQGYYDTDQGNVIRRDAAKETAAHNRATERAAETGNSIRAILGKAGIRESSADRAERARQANQSYGGRVSELLENANQFDTKEKAIEGRSLRAGEESRFAVTVNERQKLWGEIADARNGVLPSQFGGYPSGAHYAAQLREVDPGEGKTWKVGEDGYPEKIKQTFTEAQIREGVKNKYPGANKQEIDARTLSIMTKQAAGSR